MKSMFGFRLCALLIFLMSAIYAKILLSSTADDLPTTSSVVTIISVSQLNMGLYNEILAIPPGARIRSGEILDLSSGRILGKGDEVQSGYYEPTKGSSLVEFFLQPKGWSVPSWSETVSEPGALLIIVGRVPDWKSLPASWFEEMPDGPDTRGMSEEDWQIATSTCRDEPKNTMKWGCIWCDMRSLPSGFHPDPGRDGKRCLAKRIGVNEKPGLLSYVSATPVMNKKKEKYR